KAGLGDTLSKNLERLDPRARTGNKRGLSEPPQGGEFRSAGPGARGSGAFSKGYPPGLPCTDASRTSNKTSLVWCWVFPGSVQGRPRQARFTRPRLGDLGLSAQLRARITQPGPDRLRCASNLIWRIKASEGGRPLTFSLAPIQHNAHRKRATRTIRTTRIHGYTTL